MKLELSDLKEVALEDRDTFRDHYSQYPPEHSDFLHAIMYSWQDYMTYHFTKIGGSMVILGEHEAFLEWVEVRDYICELFVWIVFNLWATQTTHN